MNVGGHCCGFLRCFCCADSNKKLKDALVEFSGNDSLCKQQDEVGKSATTVAAAPTSSPEYYRCLN